MLNTSRNQWAMAVILVAAAILPAGCKKGKVDAFPALGAVAGWQKTSDTRTFAAKDLWQYIDGDAEQYVKAGVVSAATSDYKYQDKLEAVVDVYTMGDSAGAQKVFDASKSASAQSVAVGDAGVAYEQSVSFRKGPYYVRIVAYESAPDEQQALLALARGVEVKL